MNDTVIAAGTPVRVLTINRPERRNALNDDAFRGLLNAVNEATVDPDVNVIVIRGAGGTFSAGADLTPGPEPRGEEFWTKKFDLEMTLLEAIMDSSKPSIAVVDGYCLGIGFDIALACDFTITTSDARFGLPEALMGQGQLLFILPWLVSRKVASELLLAGTLLTGDKAYQLGLANSVTKMEELDGELERFCTVLGSIPPGGAAGNKQQLNAAYYEAGLAQALANSHQRAISVLSDIYGSPSGAHQGRGGKFDEIAAASGLKAAIAWQRGIRLTRGTSGSTYNEQRPPASEVAP